jgi:hypothetical protein
VVSVNQQYVCVICKNKDEDGLTLRTGWEISFFSRILPNPENAWVCSDCYSRETSNKEEIEKASKLQNLLINEFANEFLLREQKKS